jgi:drug/metabolite transporter (DMT)-like permease
MICCDLLDIAPAIIYGLLTATGFGTADFLAKLSTAKVGYLRTALFMQIIGSFLIFPFALPSVSRLFLEPWYALAGLMLGVVNALATLSLYKGFEVGRVSVVSPIASSYPVISVLLAVLFLGESVTGARLIGIALVMLGIVLVGIQSQRGDESKRLAAGVVFAVGCMLLGGFLYFGLKPVTLALGVYLPALLQRCVGSIVMACLFFKPHPKDNTQTGNFTLISAVAALDTFANVAYNAGVSVGSVSIVSTIGGLFSPITVLLAWTILKERLTRHQLLGFVAIAAGVAVLGYSG